MSDTFFKETMYDLATTEQLDGDLMKRLNKLADERKISDACGNGCPWPWCLNLKGKCEQR